MESDSTWQIIAIFALIVCSAFFSMSETALTSVGKLKVRAMLDARVKGAKRLSELKENPSKFLTAILIGNNFVNISASTLATIYTAELFGNKFIAAATGIMTFLILVFGEITPKTIAAQHAEKISLIVAGPISAFQFVLTPIIIALNFITFIILKIFGIAPNENEGLITEEVIKTILDVGHEEGVLEHDERRMINNVVDFFDYEAKTIMTPRTKIVAADVDCTYEEIVSIFKEERFSRLPVYEENIDNILGVIFVKDLVFSEQTPETFNIRELMRDTYFTYESKSSVELFATMRRERFSMAVVLDEYGGTSGIITIEDLVEEIVGEIDDEDDEASDLGHINDNEFVVDGSTRIDEVNELAGIELESRNFDSIGGYIIEVLGRFPEQGEEVVSEGVTFVVEEVEKNRIDKIRLITKSLTAQTADEDSGKINESGD